jgi:hypothetical protein
MSKQWIAAAAPRFSNGVAHGVCGTEQDQVHSCHHWRQWQVQVGCNNKEISYATCLHVACRLRAAAPCLPAHCSCHGYLSWC